MKVFTVFFAITLGHVLASHNIKRRESDEYVASTTKPITVPEIPASAPGNALGPGKYQPSPIFIPQKIQYSPPQQPNYLSQPSYKFLPQPQQASSPVSYVPQQPQQQPQYTSRVIYNTQAVPKVPIIPQKVTYSPIQAHAPAPAQYSLAGDVSSFKYTSPFVSYSNQGVLQQSTGKSSAPASAQQETPARPHYTQQFVQQNPNPEPLPRPVTYTQPQQLIYRPKLQLPQLAYNPVSHQQPTAAPAPKLVYSQVPQAIGNIPRPQSIYQPVTQKLAASVPQQILYRIPQQVAYTPVQSPHSPQPVQPAHSVAHPVYVVAPQYQYPHLNSDLGQSA